MNSMKKKINDIFLDELSKYKFFREKSSKLRHRFFNEVSNSLARKKFLRGIPRRIFYSKQPWYYAPKHFSGGLILNVLGYGVIRQYFFNKKIQKIKSNARFIKLENSGVQIIPNFVGNEFVKYVRNYYQKNICKAQEYVPGFKELIIFSNLKHIENDHSTQDLLRYIESNINFKKIFYEITSTELRVKPWVSIINHASKSDHDREFTPQLDGNNIPHRDVTFPSYKIFIYLNDVDQNNGAFQYYEGTHKFIDQSNIYKYSIDHYWTRKNVPLDQSKKIGLQSIGSSQNGSAGTAVFFNVAGIHRRGEFHRDQDRERIVLLIDFRQNDAFFIPKKIKI
jgi:hypothetical protein